MKKKLQHRVVEEEKEKEKKNEIPLEEDQLKRRRINEDGIDIDIIADYLEGPPLSRRDPKTMKWVQLDFVLNKKKRMLSSIVRLYITHQADSMFEDETVSIDLSQQFKIKMTQGLWPGFQLSYQEGIQYKSETFHAESIKDAEYWLNLLQSL